MRWFHHVRWALAVPLLSCNLQCNPFITSCKRTVESECKANLKAAYTAQRSFFQEQDRYSVSMKEIGFNPERRNRYAYFLTEAPVMQERTTSELKLDDSFSGVGVDAFARPAFRRVSRAELPAVFAGGLRLGIDGMCPDCDVTMACGAQLDGDPVLDVWSISTRERVAPDGETIPAGAPFAESTDRERRSWF